VNGHSEEQGAARAPLVFPFCTGYSETRAEQGRWFLIASFCEVVEQGAVFFDCCEEALSTEAVECVFEIQLQQRMVRRCFCHPVAGEVDNGLGPTT
jgi:hypothetical protein